MKEGRRHRTINDIVRSGPPPEGSLLEALMRDNPNMGHAPEQRVRTPEQTLLFNELVQTPSNAFGRREKQHTYRLGRDLDHQLEYFLHDNPAINRSTILEIAIARLLHDLGE